MKLDSPGLVIPFMQSGWGVTFGRNNTGASDLWLRQADRVPSNQSPYVVPYDVCLIAISAASNGVESFDAEVYIDADVRAGGTPTDANKIAELVISSAQSGQVLLSPQVAVVSGSEIGVFMRGTGVNRPLVTLFFERAT